MGLENYFTLFGTESFWQTALNTALWIVFFTAITVAIGLIIAILADRVRYETSVKALIFIPMAISFVAAGVIWKFMYDFDPDVGTFNAGLGAVGVDPQSWLTEWPRNTFMIIIVGIWMWVGFALVILSAGLKGISTELLEAARIDGANEIQVFRNIILPLLAPTIAVVATTIVITALKTFDLVYVMTIRELRHGGDRQPLLSRPVHRRERRDRGGGRRDPAARDRPGHAHQHPPLPSAGGHAMTTGAGSGVPGPVAAAATVDAPPRPVTVAGRRSPWGRLGLHLTLAIIAIIWLLPTVSLFVSSFRPEAARC